mmetsp:Transcript_2077/g.6194  ORF Transcript_2077/g.6194 Transcript_2077/m.6194 type:complete len:159 (+) Transcript_2077:221-697(+)
MSDDSDGDRVVKRRRKSVCEVVELEDIPAGPAFDVMAAFGEDAVDLTREWTDEDKVELTRRCGGAQAMFAATLEARRQGRRVVGDEMLLGKQRWRQGTGGIDFRFSYDISDVIEGGITPESYLGKAGASRASEDRQPARGRGRGAFRGWRGRGRRGRK